MAAMQDDYTREKWSGIKRDFPKALDGQKD